MHEIISAALKVKPKGLSWDFIGCWIPRLLLLFNFEEIKEMYYRLEELTGFQSERILTVSSSSNCDEDINFDEGPSYTIKFPESVEELINHTFPNYK